MTTRLILAQINRKTGWCWIISLNTGTWYLVTRKTTGITGLKRNALPSASDSCMFPGLLCGLSQRDFKVLGVVCTKLQFLQQINNLYSMPQVKPTNIFDYNSCIYEPMLLYSTTDHCRVLLKWKCVCVHACMHVYVCECVFVFTSFWQPLWCTVKAYWLTYWYRIKL